MNTLICLIAMSVDPGFVVSERPAGFVVTSRPIAARSPACDCADECLCVVCDCGVKATTGATAASAASGTVKSAAAAPTKYARVAQRANPADAHAQAISGGASQGERRIRAEVGGSIPSAGANTVEEAGSSPAANVTSGGVAQPGRASTTYNVAAAGRWVRSCGPSGCTQVWQASQPAATSKGPQKQQPQRSGWYLGKRLGR